MRKISNKIVFHVLFVSMYTCLHVQASKAAFHELIQVDADSVWLILNDVYCSQSPIVSTDDILPPVHVIHCCLFSASFNTY